MSSAQLKDPDELLKSLLLDYQRSRNADAKCPAEFDYRPCNDKDISILLSDPNLKSIFDNIRAENDNFKKENAVMTEALREKKKLTDMLSELDGLTLDDFIGPKVSKADTGTPSASVLPPSSPPLFASPPPKSQGWMDRIFKRAPPSMAPQSQPTRCPLYSQKLDFTKCNVAVIYNFLLNNSKIAGYLMERHTEVFNLIVENKSLRDENEKLKLLIPELKKMLEEIEGLKFRVNVIYREKLHKPSPFKLNWKMSYADGGRNMHSRRGRGRGRGHRSRRRSSRKVKH